MPDSTSYKVRVARAVTEFVCDVMRNEDWTEDADREVGWTASLKFRTAFNADEDHVLLTSHEMDLVYITFAHGLDAGRFDDVPKSQRNALWALAKRLERMPREEQ